MTQDILPAQPPRRALLQVGGATALLILLVVAKKLWIGPWLLRYTSVPDRAVGIAHFRLLMDGVAAFIALMAAFPAWVGWRILRSGQFPHPSAWVYRDTPIRRGTAAKARGFALLACAALLLGCAILMQRIPGRFLTPAPEPSAQRAR